MSNMGTKRFSPCPPPSAVLIEIIPSTPIDSTSVALLADINCIYATLCSQKAATRSHVVWQRIIRNVICRPSTYPDSQRQYTYYLVCVRLGLGRLFLRFLDHTQLETRTSERVINSSQSPHTVHLSTSTVKIVLSCISGGYRNFPDIRMLIWWPG
jgi:hypothetical protein